MKQLPVEAGASVDGQRGSPGIAVPVRGLVSNVFNVQMALRIHGWPDRGFLRGDYVLPSATVPQQV